MTNASGNDLGPEIQVIFDFWRLENVHDNVQGMDMYFACCLSRH